MVLGGSMFNTKEEAKETLNNIIDYLGVDKKYKDDVYLISYIEWVIERGKNK
jgi:hypothetical protein